MGFVYGCCRISTARQNMERQKRNILKEYPDAKIIEEVYTGTKIERPAFEQSQKEVDDLHQRTREGIKRARRNGKQIGRKPGAIVHARKEAGIKRQLRKYARDFDGMLTDVEAMKQIGDVSRVTYYKYRKQMRKADAAASVEDTTAI